MTNIENVEDIVCSIVADLIGRSPGELDRNESLIEQGVDSLEITELILQLEERFDVRLDQLVIWDNDSIAVLSIVIARLQQKD